LGFICVAAPTDGTIWVLRAHLNVKLVLTQAEGIGKDRFALAAHPSLRRLYIADRSENLVREILEECKAVTLDATADTTGCNRSLQKVGKKGIMAWNVSD
jgi:hypothetical protein